ncbi:polysaccharide lyase [Geodermatophilus sp. YIM 151500]|uniref:polysaccharide lyase n=1 Tax=Geodermatophilus sp. YIM 151500 TaxID=2984531 RepID=UPI0021E35A10|nr:polysaccharide lyase [Geodermatophilus sp. YIM 151500]MCV2490834.1 polysaccharide lyase [Geodermatophilus sp. YIM 151500]
MTVSGASQHTDSRDFCTGVQALITRFDSASTSVDPDFRENVFRQVAAETRDIEPPAEIAPDWSVLTEELDELSQTWASINSRDPSQAAAAEQLTDGITAAFIRMKSHLLEHCGVDSSAPGRRLVFTGDFETGNFGQWSQCQHRVFSGLCKDMPADFYGMQIVDSGARQGQYAARFELREGDNPSWGGGERTEVARYKDGTVREGEERWYEFSLMFDPSFPVENDNYFMVMQWHGANDLPPPMGIEVIGDGQLVLSSHFPPGPSMVIGDIARGQWVDYVVRAKFSPDEAVGWVEVYRNGVLTVPRHPRATMNSKYDYLKMGLYRDGKGPKPTAVMLADRFRITAP